MALYPGWPGWAATRKDIHSLTPCLCGYYTTSLVNFLYFSQSTASSLHICQVWQSVSITSLQVFFGLPPGLTRILTSKSMHFSPSHSHPSCLYHITYVIASQIISPTPSLSLFQLTTTEPVCYFSATHPSFSSQPTEVSTRSLSFLATFHCHVTYNFCITAHHSSLWSVELKFYEANSRPDDSWQ